MLTIIIVKYIIISGWFTLSLVSIPPFFMAGLMSTDSGNTSYMLPIMSIPIVSTIISGILLFI